MLTGEEAAVAGIHPATPKIAPAAKKATITRLPRSAAKAGGAGAAESVVSVRLPPIDRHSSQAHASRQRSRAENERLHAERGQRPHDLFVAAHFRSQHEEQQPDDERDDAAERTERSAAQQAAREDAAEEDSEQNQHRQCGILRAKIGKKADGRKLCACGRRNEVRR